MNTGAESLLPAYPTMLDYYAQTALAGLLAYSGAKETHALGDVGRVAKEAFDYAEAMLSERARRLGAGAVMDLGAIQPQRRRVMKLIGPIKSSEPKLPDNASDLPAGTKLIQPGSGELFLVVEVGTQRTVVSLESGKTADKIRMSVYEIIPPGSEFTVRV